MAVGGLYTAASRVVFNIGYFQSIGAVGFPKSGLDVVKSAKAGFRSSLELVGVRATLANKEAEDRASTMAIRQLELRLSDASSADEELRTV